MKYAIALATALLMVALFLPLAFAQNQVWIEWASSSDPDVDHYLIYRSNDQKLEPDLAADLIGSSTSLYFIDHDVVMGPDYYYWVSAIDEAGNASAFTGPLQVGSTQIEPDGFLDSQLDTICIQHLDEDMDPSDPYVDRTLDNDDEILFQWDLNIEGEPVYRIFLFYDGISAGFQCETQETTFLLDETQKETGYQLRVDAVNAQQKLLARGYSEVVTCVDDEEPISRPSQPNANVEE